MTKCPVGDANKLSDASLAAAFGIAELTRHKELLIDRLASETGRYERIALEDHIEATERLIEDFTAALATEERETIDSSSCIAPRSPSLVDTYAPSNQHD